MSASLRGTHIASAMPSPHCWLHPLQPLLIAIVASIVLAAPITRADDQVATLPWGVKAEWTLQKAVRETGPTRERVCINGLWRWQPATPDAPHPPVEGWGYFKVPGAWPGITDYMQFDAQTVFTHPNWKDVRLGQLVAAWYQREITVPPEWESRRIVLSIAVLNSLASISVDGQHAGELQFPGGELDLTPLELRPGKHELSMLVVALPLNGVMLSYTDSASAKRVKGNVARRGLCGDLFLIATPKSERIDGVRVLPSVRKSQITFETALSDLRPNAVYKVRADVLHDGRTVKRFESPELSTQDLATGRYRFTADWKPDHLWDLHTPENIQTVRVSLLDQRDKVLDVFWDERFGFREFWIDGRDFYLNGSRIFLSAVPLDNAQVSAALASYSGARESLERLKSFGINFVYTHNYGCEPGSHLAFEEILRAADDVGMLVSFSQPHFSHYDWKLPDAEESNGYRRHAAFYTQTAGNHPSIVLYSMSHNATGYAEDMNPDLYGSAEAPRDSWALNNVRLAQRAEKLVQELDSSRQVYHHASGSLGIMHATNFYPNFVPIQELSDWFEVWSTKGVKPAFTCEYGAPFTWDWSMYRGWYNNERSFGSAQVPWEFCFAEWNSQFLGDRAFQMTEMEKENLRWEARQFRAGKVWHRWDYPYEIGSDVFDDRHEVIGQYLTDNFRAFRTWGVSATSPWEHDHYWRLRKDADREREVLSVNWDSLQRPGFSADFIGPTYQRMDLAFARDDWVPTADGQALLRNNRPLLVYIAGKADQFTSKDHNAYPGETLSKQIIILNNSRAQVQCDVSWNFNLPVAISGRSHVILPTGDQSRVPINLPLPSNLAAGQYSLQVSCAFSTGVTQDDHFTFDILNHPRESRSPRTRVALFDPPGQTTTLLKSLDIGFQLVDASADLSNFDLLIIGKEALSVDQPAPRIDQVQKGLNILMFEQTAKTLEKRLGFRVLEYGLRQVFPRIPDHPLLAGLTADHLRDWRGGATLTPPRLDYVMRPMYGPTVLWCDIPVTRTWRCGNRGSVASVLIEKPACGDFLPIVDGGFSLQYSPLIEHRYGMGRMVLCQLDVTGRTESDPAAEILVQNLLSYAMSLPPLPPPRNVAYLGDLEGLDHLRSAGIVVAPYTGGKLDNQQLLVIGPGASTTLAQHAQAIAAWLNDNGSILAVGCTQEDLASLLPRVRFAKEEHITAYFEPAHAGSLFAGIGPADVHNRDPRDLHLVTEGAEVIGNGVLAIADNSRVIFCQLIPWEFDYNRQPNVKRTFRRTAFLLARLLGNLSVLTTSPLPARLSAPVPSSAVAEPRWKKGLYLDRPEEWDDPYRFFRW